MRILLVGHKNWIGMWAESTTTALTKMGHAVNVFHFKDQAISFKNRVIYRLKLSVPSIQNFLTKLARTNERLLVAVQKFTPDLVLVLKGETLRRETLQAIRQKNILLATWWVDDPFVFDEAAQGFANYDAFFVFDSHYIPKLMRLGIPHVEFLPCACAVDIFRPMRCLTLQELANYQCDVAFVGRYFSPREEMFKELRNKDVAIWGPGDWKENPAMKRYIDIEQAFRSQTLPPLEAAKLYSTATICLNLNHHQTVFDGLNQRAFEIPACGGFQLVDYRPGFESLFATNEEVVYYNSFDEIGDIVEYFLSHPDERKEIARQGYERAIKEHSYERRMEKILAWATRQLEDTK